jgi:hypothetical protein
MFFRFIWPVLVGSAVGSTCVLAQDKQSEVLDYLSQALREIRAADTLSEPLDPTNFERPAAGTLLGASRDLVWTALGKPDNCANSQECAETREWIYDFVRFPPGWRGGGWSLVLSFESGDACTSASWALSR